MVPEIGQFALIMALLLALTQATIPLIGAARGNRSWIAVAAPAGQAQFIFVAIAFCCLGYSFITNDFSVLNVATNSNSQLPLHYRLAATWGSHEGSLLLWVLMLAFPFPYIANTLGWMTAELGRQPWLIYGLFHTRDGYSKVVSNGDAIFTLIGFTGLYFVLGLLFLGLTGREIGKGPEEQATSVVDQRRAVPV